MSGRSIFDHKKVNEDVPEVEFQAKPQTKKPISILFEYPKGNYLQSPTRLRVYYENTHNGGQTAVYVPLYKPKNIK